MLHTMHYYLYVLRYTLYYIVIMISYAYDETYDDII